MIVNVANEFETVQKIIKDRCGISRYGDGELRLCLGRKQMSQPWSPAIQKRLREVLKSGMENHLVGIPRILNRDDWPTIRKKKFWKRYAFDIYMRLYDPSKQYYSSFITRPDAVSEVDTQEFWNLVKQCWKDRQVLLLQGEGREFLKDPTIFETAERVELIYGPRFNAFAEYDDVLKLILDNSKPDTLVVISLGPTATVLAHDVCKEGIQALDLGHLGVFYARYHPKSPRYTGEPYDTGI